MSPVNFSFFLFFFFVKWIFISQAVDAGDTMFVHVFGAYFGLAVSFVLGIKDKPTKHNLEGASYNSDIFAMIGLFLSFFLRFTIEKHR